MANIGKLALTVTANAAPLGKTLDAVEAKTEKTGKAVEKNLDKPGGGSGGFMAGLAGGAVVVGLAAVGKGIAAIVPMLADARKNALALGQTFSAMEHTKLGRVEEAFHGVKSAIAGTLARVAVALEPAITALASAFVQLLAAAQPALTWIGEKMGVGISYAIQTVVGTVKILGSQIVELWRAFAGSAGISEWFDKWPTWGDAVKGVLKLMTKVFFFFWDASKVAAGNAIVAVARLVEQIIAAVKAMGKLRAVLPTIAGPLGIAANMFTDSQLDSIGKVAAAAKTVGSKMMASAGLTAAQIEEMFGKMTENVVTNFRKKFVAYNPAAALLAGSAAEYSVRIKAGMEGKLNPQLDIARKQLAEQVKANQILGEIRQRKDAGLIVEVI